MRKLVSAIVLLSAIAPVALADWTYPTPATTEVPGNVVPDADPNTYADESLFQSRAESILEGLRLNADLQLWRRGYFSGGDPGKYVPSVVAARLLKDPADADAVAIMNDDRSFKEHYHFAALNWGRFYPIFGDAVLTPDTKRKFADSAFRYNYLNATGTENHRTMSMTSANVLPWYIDRGLSNKPKDETLAIAKEKLRAYVKGLYFAGQGEWDSSTYWAFGVNGMLNIYDFSKDEECRLLARAALDWYVAGYALKYRDGLFAGPNQRGHYAKPHDSIADKHGYLWWGSHATVTSEMLRRAHHSLEPITSGYRPNLVLSNLAKKSTLTLPVDQRNTKPNYWYGLDVYPNPNGYAEWVHVAPTFTMGTLFNGHGSQITRFQIVADSPSGAVAFTGGHVARSDHLGNAEGFGYADGIGRYESTAQVGPVAMCVWNVPDDVPFDHGFFSIPEGVTPKQIGDVIVMQAGETLVAVRGIGTPAQLGEADLTKKQLDENKRETDKGKPAKHAPKPIIRFTGKRAGWVVEVSSTKEHATPEAFAAALQKKAIEPDTGPDFGATYTALNGTKLELVDKSNDITNAGVVHVNGEPIDYKSWDHVFDGPYVQQRDGVLTVNDGERGFVVDFSGELPVYKAWEKK